MKSNIKKGDIIKVTKALTSCLTTGKTYKVVGVMSGRPDVVDDEGNETTLLSSRWTKVHLPELKPGMIVAFKWRRDTKEKLYLYLGNETTLAITSPADRSQPFSSKVAELTKIYSVKNMESWYDYTGNSAFGARTLIWEAKTEQQEQIEELKATIEQAQRQIQAIEEAM